MKGSFTASMQTLALFQYFHQNRPLQVFPCREPDRQWTEPVFANTPAKLQNRSDSQHDTNGSVTITKKPLIECFHDGAA